MIVAGFTVAVCCGCAAFWAGELPSVEQQETELGVEVLWEVPLQPVEFYHVYYGTVSGQPDGYQRVGAAELEKIDDPVYGPVYRHVLRGVSRDRDLYVTLRAENRSGISETSQQIRIAAQADPPPAGAMP